MKPTQQPPWRIAPIHQRRRSWHHLTPLQLTAGTTRQQGNYYLVTTHQRNFRNGPPPISPIYTFDPAHQRRTE